MTVPKRINYDITKLFPGKNINPFNNRGCDKIRYISFNILFNSLSHFQFYLKRIIIRLKLVTYKIQNKVFGKVCLVSESQDTEKILCGRMPNRNATIEDTLYIKL